MDNHTPETAKGKSGPIVSHSLLTSSVGLVSTVALLLAVLVSTIFLYAYLSVFDQHLMWIVEYSDILKVGLVAVAVMSGFAFWLYSVIDDVYHWVTTETRSVKLAKRFSPVPLLVSLSLWLYVDYKFAEPHYALHIYFHLSILLLALLAYWTINLGKSFPNINFSDLTYYVFLCIVTISIFGRTFAYYVRDSEGFRHNVTIKNEEIPNLGVIMLTSHHAVLYSDQVIVVPMSDVSTIVSIRPNLNSTKVKSK